MSLTEAIKEAYADPDIDAVILDTLELDHVSFETPVRIFANGEEDIMLPLINGGPPVLFQACGVTITLSGFDDDGATSGSVRMDNVSGLLHPYLREAVKAGNALKVTYRAYVEGKLTEPGEVRGGMILSKVSLTATTATGTLEHASKHERQAFPRLTYNLASYRALHGF